MSVLSRLGIAASILDQEVKRFLRSLINVGTIAAAGSTQADATAITTGKVAVTAADGAKGVILPVAEVDMVVEVINTVSNQDLLVYPNSGAVINALSADAAFTVVAGASRTFVCDAALHWYVGAGNLSGTATTSSTTELNRLDGALDTNLVADKAAILGVGGALTLGGALTAVGSVIIGSADLNEADMEKLDGITNGTQAANKAVVADANVNTGVAKVTALHIGVSGSEVQVTATPAELNMAADNSANVEIVAATNVITAAESGKTFFLNHATEFVSTLPAPAAGLRFTFIVTGAPSGADYTIVTDSAAQVIFGHQVSVAGDAGDVEATGGATTITFVGGQSVVGDRATLISDGTNWYAEVVSAVAAGATITG